MTNDNLKMNNPDRQIYPTRLLRTSTGYFEKNTSGIPGLILVILCNIIPHVPMSIRLNLLQASASLSGCTGCRLLRALGGKPSIFGTAYLLALGHVENRVAL